MSNCAPIDFSSPGGIGDTAWAINPNDFLVVTGASSQAGEKLNINLRFVQEDQTLFDQIQLSLTAGDRSVQQIKYDFGKLFDKIQNRTYARPVYLSDVSIEAAVATTRGQTFARVNLYRFGTSVNQNVKPIAKCAILSDYVTIQVTACLRNARHFTSIEGPGNIRTVIIAQPLPQSDWSVTVPANARWRIISISGSVSMDANAGNRRVDLLIFPDGVNLTWDMVFLLVANDTLIFDWASGVPFTIASAGIGSLKVGTISMGEGTILLPGGILKSSTGFVGVADQWGSTGLQIEEWLDNV